MPSRAPSKSLQPAAATKKTPGRKPHSRFNPTRNRLLRDLPASVWRALEPEPFAMPRGLSLFQPDEPAKWTYFPEAGMISLVLRAGGRDVESSIVGREGMAGMPVLLGQERTLFQATVQMAGKGLRVESARLEHEFKRGGALQERLLAYVAAVLGQQTQLALCSHVHTPLEKLARWLLMTSDRAGEKNGSNEFDLPPEFLAQMLATNAANAAVIVGTLQRAGLLTYSGNHFVLLSRREMEDASCDCYGHIQEIFKRLLG